MMQIDARGVPEKWNDHAPFARATPQRYGYGRYFRFTGVRGVLLVRGLIIRSGLETRILPFWLWANHHFQARDRIGKELSVQVQDGQGEYWVPVHPKLDVEYPEVLDDIASKLKAVAKIVGADLPKRPA